MSKRDRIDSWKPIIKETPTCCQMCEREVDLTFHHTIPCALHSTNWFKKNYTKEQMDDGIYICHLCHNFIHHSFCTDEKKLGREYNTLEKLLAAEEIKKFIIFAKKQR